MILPLLTLLVTSQLQGSPDRPAPPPSSVPGLAYTELFFPGATTDPAVPTPDSILGFPVGTRPATYAQVDAVGLALADKSPRLRRVEYATSHEGRTLSYWVIASEANIKRLDDLKAGWAKLADPRSCTPAEADALAASLPACAWMAYCIHGDEMSGTDAALAVAHHLAASTDDDIKRLLDDLVIIIDPLMNPDGRDRNLAQIVQNRTIQPNVDDQSLLHAGFWPSGRTNHYLFDMNRDWIFATQPETRGRLAAVQRWHPHYFMESHEMGSQDTFLFMPGREAINPNLPANVRKWEPRFAADQAAAFDQRGWRYYTGEWNDNWYPGYSSAWAALRGMVENLYEQASIGTDAVRRPEGTLESYREAVHKQLVSTMVNLRTLAAHRAEVLADFVAEKRACVAGDAPHAARTFAVVPAANPSRLARFTELLDLQGFEYARAAEPFTGAGADRLGIPFTGRVFPAGTLLIPARQPLARLLLAMLEFDPRMNDQFLADQRRELLRFDRSLIYDVTGWSITMLFDVDCFELASGSPSATEPAAPAAAQPALRDPDSTVGFVIDGGDDRSLAAAARLLQQGFNLRGAAKPFRFDDRDFSRGSIVITRKDNSAIAADFPAAIQAACAAVGAGAVGIPTGLGVGDLPDLGGEHFVLLDEPRVAILARDPHSAYSFGQAWYTIDHTLGLRASALASRDLGGADLRRYNLLVVPDGSPSAVAGTLDALRAWVEAGGTLIAIGRSCAAFAREKDGVGSTRLLPDVLAAPEPYFQAVIREWEGLTAAPDPAAVWSFSPPATALPIPWDGAAPEKLDADEAKRRDDWRRIFMPEGALLAARVDDRSWLTGGCGDVLPILHTGDTPLVCPPGVSAPLRFGVFIPTPEKPAPDAQAGEPSKPEKPRPGWAIAPPGHQMRLRMGGLLWPEAAERIANTAYVTREAVGKGQVILFAGDPNFRAASLGASRVFQNAVVLGPGMGASRPIRP